MDAVCSQRWSSFSSFYRTTSRQAVGQTGADVPAGVLSLPARCGKTAGTNVGSWAKVVAAASKYGVAVGSSAAKYYNASATSN